MVPLASLWLPILLSAVVVFVASSIIHMLLPYHRTDYGPVAAEDQLMEDFRRAGVGPGDYVVPHAGSMAAMKDPVFQEKYAKGPVVFFTVIPGQVSMARSMSLWFLYALVVALFAGYVAGRALGPGAEYAQVFRFAGATAVAGFSLGLAHGSIWYGRRWSTTLKSMGDGVVYAVLTAGVFGWLWPGA